MTNVSHASLMRNSLEKLTLRCAGVAEQQQVDVSTNAMLAIDILGHATKPASKMSLFHGGEAKQHGHTC